MIKELINRTGVGFTVIVGIAISWFLINESIREQEYQDDLDHKVELKQNKMKDLYENMRIPVQFDFESGKILRGFKRSNNRQ